VTDDREPCGQHTVFEPQCRTCARIAELRGALEVFVLDADIGLWLWQNHRKAIKQAQSAWFGQSRREGP
jgi:hypothetical protein